MNFTVLVMIVKLNKKTLIIGIFLKWVSRTRVPRFVIRQISKDLVNNRFAPSIRRGIWVEHRHGKNDPPWHENDCQKNLEKSNGGQRVTCLSREIGIQRHPPENVLNVIWVSVRLKSPATVRRFFWSSLSASLCFNISKNMLENQGRHTLKSKKNIVSSILTNQRCHLAFLHLSRCPLETFKWPALNKKVVASRADNDLGMWVFLLVFP